MMKPITIVGGGLAGLALGIGLRRGGVPVTVWEAGRYPRHRVCGEFISGRGLDALARLDLLSAIENAGARPARTAAFYDRALQVPPRPLPQPALCISRFVLDKLLADTFQSLGGDLKVGTRWSGTDGEGIVHASGRHVEPVVDGYRWIGLKIHARNVALAANLELHFLSSGYVGVCQLGQDEVNICGLFRSKTTFHELAKNWRQWLRGPEDSVLFSRLSGADFEEETFCTVAGLDTRPRKGEFLAECCVGDALTMIPPMTGNGMSMAFESAELAIGLLTEYSRGHLPWVRVQWQIAQACDERFGRRLLWADRLQRLLFQPPARAVLMRLNACSETFGRALFRLTR